MLRAAICGAGRWGTRLIESVGRAKATKIGFVAAVTRDPAGKRALADRFGLKLTASYADVLADAEHRRGGAGDAAFAARGRDRRGGRSRQARVRGKAVHVDARRRRGGDRRLPRGRHHARRRLQPALRAVLCRHGAPHRGRRDRHSCVTSRGSSPGRRATRPSRAIGARTRRKARAAP